jgi:hypothetical protein
LLNYLSFSLWEQIAPFRNVYNNTDFCPVQLFLTLLRAKAAFKRLSETGNGARMPEAFLKKSPEAAQKAVFLDGLREIREV